MTQERFLLIFILMLLLGFNVKGNNPRDSLKGRDIHFTENKGQWDSKVMFRADLNNGAVFLEKEG